MEKCFDFYPGLPHVRPYIPLQILAGEQCVWQWGGPSGGRYTVVHDPAPIPHPLEEKVKKSTDDVVTPLKSYYCAEHRILIQV